MFHFTSEDLWLAVSSLAGMQFPDDAGFDKGKFSVKAFLKPFRAADLF